jgi:Sugar-transfer associated ATP-grasp
MHDCAGSVYARPRELEKYVTTQALRAPIGLLFKPLEKLKAYAAASRIAAGGRRPYLSLLAELAKLRLGKGRLSFDEYVGLNLFDDTIYRTVDKSAFVGLRATQKIWLQANYRVDLFGLVNNKLACDMLFATHGFPILPTVAMFHEDVGIASPFLLRTSDELRAFMRSSKHYPMFGKPVCGTQSIGSASLDRYDGEIDRLVTTTGHSFSVDTFVSFVKAHSASGYVFQKRISPHSAVREICGDRLATVRFLTIVTKGEARVLRACWKIPAGVNAADNFWRPGNLLAQLDRESGRVVRVMRANGQKYEEVTHHPDSGIRLQGLSVPNWQELLLFAIEGAKMFADTPLIGWDIAPVDGGAIMVEANVTPDMKLHQLADRRGMLDGDFKAFLAEKTKHAADASRNARHMLG